MNAPESSPGKSARGLLRAADRGYLATQRRQDAEAPGWPYAAVVLLAVDFDASPLLLISALAEHTQDIARDDRVALLVDGTAGLADPLTGARATLLGRIARTDAPRHRARFLARHPSAASYADFKDFAFYRLAVERAHLVAGFGRIHWVAGGDLIDPAGDSAGLVAAESGIVQHMNRDHAEALALYAIKLLRQPPGAWTMTGIDAEGLDLRLGGRVARLEFQRRIATAEEARAELARLAKQARSL
ncbi:MAG: HugZ family pyridoxamine 5'-phosphate oxidase [Rhodospirillales bacterium]